MISFCRYHPGNIVRTRIIFNQFPSKKASDGGIRQYAELDFTLAKHIPRRLRLIQVKNKKIKFVFP